MSMPAAVSSRQNPRFKELRQLAANPGTEGMALAEGVHLVETCQQRQVDVRQLVVSASGLNNPEIAALLQVAPGIEVLTLADGLFREIAGTTTPTGIAAVFVVPTPVPGPLLGDAVLLDAVQDAGNVGTLLRTAAAAGVRDVLLGPGCAGAWSPRVLRAAQGAHFSLAIRERVDLLAVLRATSGRSVATVAEGGGSLYDLDLTGPVLWLFGNEGAGLTPDLCAAATARARIPLASGIESLNVAAAAAVCLFEAHRQRLKTKEPARGGLPG